MNNNNNKIIYKHIFRGFIIGLLIVSLLYIYDLIRYNYSFTEAFLVHIKSIPYLIIYSAPFVLGIYGYTISKQYIKKIIDLDSSFENELTKNKKVNEFIIKLKNGETSAEFELTTNDVLGQSLIELRNHLEKTNIEETKRKQEDFQRSWINEGLARFGDILRKDISNMETLSYNIISNLVKFLNANQGGFFIINDEFENERFFYQTACYAYDRKKFADKRVDWGEGLIGTCAQERETIYIENLPTSYVDITSGLGKATPKSLLIVPMKYNDQVHGIIELASFHRIESYQVSFVEKVAENIASILSSVKLNEKTARLLKESRGQSEILSENEEQMRQNMEELQAAQEEATRQSERFIEFTNTVNHTLLRAEFAIDGTLIYANTKFLLKLGYSSNNEVEGKHISMFINNKDKEWFFKIWDKLSKGGKHFEGNMKQVTKQGKDLWTMATYTCMKKSDDSIDRILFLGLDITEQKQLSLDYEGQLEALNRATIKAMFTVEGEFMDCNKQFLEAYLYESISDIEDKKIFDLIDRLDLIDFRKEWKNVLEGQVYQGIIKGTTRDKDTKWFHINLSAVRDMYGDIAKIIYLAQDITKEKLMEIESKKQTEILIKQEELLKESEIDLQRKLEKAKRDMKLQFKEIEKIKLRTEKTLEGSLDAILTIDNNGLIQFFNNAAEDLWKIRREDVMGKNAEILFSVNTKNNEDFVKRLLSPKEEKIIGERREVKIQPQNEDEVQVLFLLSEAKISDEHTFTAFIQKIEVELF